MTTATTEPDLRSTDTVACCVCGGSSSSPYLTGLVDYLTDESFDIDRCDRCRLLVTRPLPAGDAIGRYYPDRYRGNRHAFTGRLRNNLRRRAVESFFPRGFKGRLLDVGCGNGDFARHMQARGWDVSATEIDGPTVDRLRAAGVDARQSQLAEEGGFERPFDAVTCWHVLEHVERPKQTVEWVKTQLAPGAIFQPTVPNAASLQARLFGRRWVHFDVPRHRQHFTPATLRSLLESAGYAVKKRTDVAWEYDWFGVIQSAINTVYPKPNVLFEKLTGVRQSPASGLDTTVSFAAAYVIAAASAGPLLATAAAGDGATLTLTCGAGG